MARPRPTAFLSSTSIDLPEHRRKVTDAILALGLFPDGMEHWPAADSDSLDFCLAKVDQADLFIGIYAHRYGWVPPGQDRSITELEYDRAVERGIPRYLFLMSEDHPVLRKDVETGDGETKLQTFKARIQTERVRQTFDNPDQLHAKILHALADHRPHSPLPPGEGPGVRARPTSIPTTPKIDLQHLPKGAPHFLGREQELDWLDESWGSADQPGPTDLVQLIAAGGTGKTALLRHWLFTRLKPRAWAGAARVFGWSFYSQGSSDDRQATEENFLEAALDWFGCNVADTASAHDKGLAIAAALVKQRGLLVLDGCEPLQYPPSNPTLAGQLKTPGLKALLTQLASAGHPGLCVLTSRQHLSDLDEFRDADSEAVPLRNRDLGNLDDADAARLLHRAGAQRAGASAIAADAAADHPDLRQAGREVKGHALTLSLLGGYLREAEGGDILRRDVIDWGAADAEHAFHVMAAYERWFAGDTEHGPRHLAALRLLGFFDRPAQAESLAALRAAPPITGLTEALQDLSDADWRRTLSHLRDLGLIQIATATGEAAGRDAADPPPAEGRLDTQPLDAHPLIREYLARRLCDQQHHAWREGHRRIYEQLKTSCPHRPDGLAGLQPLYQAVAHGCLAGQYQEALDEVYFDRILRGTGSDGFYSIDKLGAFGADLGAIVGFFDPPWQHPVPALDEAVQAWLLSQAGICLRALGRLTEALEPMRAGAEMLVKQEEWKQAATAYSNLSELQLTLGRVPAAVADAESALAHAERSGDAFQRMGKGSTLADALHQHGEAEAPLTRFHEAEALQGQEQPQYPLLYSLPGFWYCDRLLAEAEGAAWTAWLADREGLALAETDAPATPPTTASPPSPSQPAATKTWPAAALATCDAVTQRATQTLAWAEQNKAALLTIALEHLTLARAGLYAALLKAHPATRLDPAALIATRAELDRAVDGLRAAGQDAETPRGLLTRAWLRRTLGDTAGAHADLADAQRIAARGGMRLHLADLHLTRARLFPEPRAAAHAELRQARALIEACEYRRRVPELEAAEAALGLATTADRPSPP
ncbi:MAG: DUF4062 domain-containing protein [Gammaproteobacteria bacterium]